MTASSARLNLLEPYEQLKERAGWVDLGKRTQIEIGGADRTSFLHNLCTNEIRKLPVGSGCEAFLTSVQGKTLAHLFAFATPDSLLLDTVPGESEKILKHLDHYLVCEQVTLVDRGQDRSEVIVCGAESARVLSDLVGVQLSEVRLSHAPATIGGRKVWLRKVDLAGPVGFLISIDDADLGEVRAEIESALGPACERAALEALRIEWGFPWFGIDISEKNLPQEVGRDALAISFVKGCYLGQETVARIDALGHVNKTLVGLRFLGDEIPQTSIELSHSGQIVGEVTSAAYSSRFAAPVALGYVRRGSNAPGTRVSSSAGDAEIVALPMA